MYIRNRQTATSSEDFGYAPEHLEELVLDLEFTFAEVGLSRNMQIQPFQNPTNLVLGWRDVEIFHLIPHARYPAL